MGYFQTNLLAAMKKSMESPDEVHVIIKDHITEVREEKLDLDRLNAQLEEYCKALESAVENLREKNMDSFKDNVLEAQKLVTDLEKQTADLLRREHKFLE